jgi:hypothetical protein
MEAMFRLSLRRALVFTASTLGFFLAGAIVWLYVYMATTFGGECAYEEVHCSPFDERMGTYGPYGFVGVFVIALTLGWLVARPDRRRPL